MDDGISFKADYVRECVRNYVSFPLYYFIGDVDRFPTNFQDFCTKYFCGNSFLNII